MKKALVVGINYYKYANELDGCVNDAYEIENVLKRHSDGTKNFDVKKMISTCEDELITYNQLMESIEELFNDDSLVALLYFSGHGHVDNDCGYIVSSDCNDENKGVSLTEVLLCANNSRAKNKIIILDCCHAGYAGKLTMSKQESILNTGVTILAASREDQYAIEQNGSGVFTTLLVDALNGGAADILGRITPGSVYAYIDQSLGTWAGQRPIFKTNIQQFISLRDTQPAISITDLRRITDFFEKPGISFQLDPTYEPDRSFDPENKYPAPIEENVIVFKMLQKYNRINLVVPEGEEHMFNAAINSKSCKLTVLGEHYWRLIKNDNI
ncbi:MAG: caspase domain-containing protein [Campylobacteraceae bacterium]